MVLWILGSLLLAALIAPWIHLGGKNLAAYTAAHDTAAWIEWLGAACGRSKFTRFFDRALMLSAVLLLPILLRRIRSLRQGNPNFFRKQAALPLSKGIVQWMSGLLIAGGTLGLLGMALVFAGAYTPDDDPISYGRIISKAVVPALAVSAIEEWLFRGLLLGIWLKLTRPIPACLGTSAVFAFLHFLEPSQGAVIADPNAAGAGFVLLGQIFMHFMAPLFLLAEFATLFTVGMILAQARIQTGSLWFPIGLHAGWILALKGCNLINDNVSNSPLRPWWIGESLSVGLFPLATLLVTAWICHIVAKRFFAPTSA